MLNKTKILGKWGMAIFAGVLYLVFLILGLTAVEMTTTALILWLATMLVTSVLVSVLIALWTVRKEKLLTYTATVFTIIAASGIVWIVLAWLLNEAGLIVAVRPI
jgi:hypothetical protein